jgi:adenylate kinase
MSEQRIFVVLLGVPGAGKGTQAKLLEQSTGLPQISTGDIFRYNLKNQTELGKLAKSYMDRGDLVPDEVTIRMVEDRLQQPDCARGAIMDGFPRNLVQATAFDKMTAPYGGVHVAPLHSGGGRRDDPAHHRAAFLSQLWRDLSHRLQPAKAEGVCDVDGGELYQRDDDKEDTVRNRLFVYYKQTAPLIGYYYAKNLLREIDGTMSIEAVRQALVAVVG